VRKVTLLSPHIVIVTSSLILKNKIEKDNFLKKHKKQQKKNYVRKYCSIPQCFKEKIIKLNSQPAQY